MLFFTISILEFPVFSFDLKRITIPAVVQIYCPRVPGIEPKPDAKRLQVIFV